MMAIEDPTPVSRSGGALKRDHIVNMTLSDLLSAFNEFVRSRDLVERRARGDRRPQPPRAQQGVDGGDSARMASLDRNSPFDR
jgi:hypothetical protein